MLLVAIPACYKDAHLVARNLALCASFERATTHHALLAIDTSVPREEAAQLHELARRCFATVHRFDYDAWRGSLDAPAPQNYAWQSTARYIEATFNKPRYTGWLWWEADACPLRNGWLDALHDAHVAGRQPFTGHLRENSYMNGVGIWPIDASNWLSESGAMYVRSAPFDRQAGSEVRARLCAVNQLILHHLKDRIGGNGISFDRVSCERLLAQNTQAVLLHGCTDGSLQALLSNGALAAIETPTGARKTASTASFYHAGSLGDVVYAMPAMRALGGGVLHLGPVATTTQRARNALGEAQYNFIAPLLAAQPYVTQCVYAPVPPAQLDYDLNAFRHHYARRGHDRTTSIAALVLRAFRLDESLCDAPWLDVVAIAPPTPVLINRSERYHNAHFDWRRVLREYPCAFVGCEDEYALFCSRYSCFDTLAHLVTLDALLLAKLIASSSLFVGNQSLCYAIAEALKHRTLQETYTRAPDCVYVRSNAVYARPTLPEQLPALDVPLVTISIACYEKCDMTRACLTSLLEHTPRNVRIVVTNNGSQDGTKAMLAEYIGNEPRISIVTCDDNRGYSAPHNAAFAASQAEFFVALNNDIVVRGDWLSPLLDAMHADAQLGAVGALGACSVLSRDMHGSPGALLEYVEGSCLMVRRSAALSVGATLFAPYVRFAYGEDSDLSLRLRERGWRISALPLPIEHVRGATARITPARYNVALHAEANHAALRARWRVYLQRRTFDYRVLVVRAGAMGDVLFTTPVIEALRTKWPQCSITVQTQCPSIFTSNPHVALATATPQAHAAFDYIYDLDLAYERRPHLHSVVAFADVCGVELPAQWSYRLYASPGDRAWASDIARGAPLVLMHIGPTAWRGKNWPIERFDELARFVRMHGYRVALVGTESHTTIATHDLDLRGRTSPQQLVALAHHAALFVGLDSFPAHACEAAHCAVVNVCGVCDARLRSMPTSRTIAVLPSSDVPCALELHRLPAPVTFAQCDGACIDSISAARVRNAVADLLGIEVAVSAPIETSQPVEERELVDV